MSSRRLAVVLTLLLGWMCSGFSQTNKTNVTADNSSGLAPGQTFGGSLENVNYPTGGVNVQIPFVNLPGRHGSNLSIGLTYDSKPLLALTGSWDEAQGAGVYNVGFPSDPVALPGGWRVNIPFIQANVHTRLVTGPSNKACFQNFVVTTADGSSHTFNNHAGCASTAKAFPYTVTADPASNISLASADDLPVLQLDTTNPSDYVLRGKDGTSFHFFANFGLAYADPSGADADPVVKLADQIVDANGNTITITQTNGNIVFKDTLGQSASPPP